MPILKPSWRRKVNLFETVTPHGYSIHWWPDVTPQIAFSSKGKVPNRKKKTTTTAPLSPINFKFKGICGVTSGQRCMECSAFSILLEGGVTVSNNFTQRRQSGFNIGTRDKFGTHLRQENFISNDIVIYTIFFTITDQFPIQFSIYTSCRIHHVF